MILGCLDFRLTVILVWFSCMDYCLSQSLVDPLGQDFFLLGGNFVFDICLGHGAVLGEINNIFPGKVLHTILHMGSRPKWQYAAVGLYFGSLNAKSRAKAPGRASKLILTMSVMSWAVSPSFPFHRFPRRATMVLRHQWHRTIGHRLVCTSQP